MSPPPIAGTRASKKSVAIHKHFVPTALVLGRLARVELVVSAFTARRSAVELQPTDDLAGRVGFEPTHLLIENQAA
jgi:hypothetical protein